MSKDDYGDATTKGRKPLLLFEGEEPLQPNHRDTYSLIEENGTKRKENLNKLFFQVIPTMDEGLKGLEVSVYYNNLKKLLEIVKKHETNNYSIRSYCKINGKECEIKPLRTTLDKIFSSQAMNDLKRTARKVSKDLKKNFAKRRL